MKKILMLGGYGFISTNILKYIDENYAEEYEVIIFDRIMEHPKGVKFNCVKKVYAGDFSDETNIIQIFNDNEINSLLNTLESSAKTQNEMYDLMREQMQMLE